MFKSSVSTTSLLVMSFNLTYVFGCNFWENQCLFYGF